MFVGLYFGSFNPVHNGHLQIAGEMLRQVGFDELWFVVSPQNPLKEISNLASNAHRLAMLRLALDDVALPVKVSDVEFGLPIPSYTFKTLEMLSQDHPTYRFALIMGSDNLAVIEKWKEYQHLLEKYPVYFYPREGDNSEALAAAYDAQKVNASLLDISSTQIRNLVLGEKPIEHLVPSKVAAYIRDNGLYR
ncbi:nicotinate (nicotinamide) nucleotide adenylyltransferase [uncultured Acetobacteroides sp.]|uniref:nicotinate (nicotinamide) nucleotide adenylyltransferase n=1 Tax=uncultured Acetobacteroides sp. TaxID=1760811 RepID=UPI0029F574DA|nr:nicotinate (nicotinamide) nucleotide adenylyltransferase [uncultured Acetobacteroides sp.]